MQRNFLHTRAVLEYLKLIMMRLHLVAHYLKWTNPLQMGLIYAPLVAAALKVFEKYICKFINIPRQNFAFSNYEELSFNSGKLT